jgi:hypothetical protein
MLNLESLPGRRNTHEHPAVDRTLSDAFVRAAHTHTDDDDITLSDHFQDFRLPIGKSGADIVEILD